MLTKAKYHDLRSYLTVLEQQGKLKRVKQQVSAELEITEICHRTLQAGGPALLFENVTGSETPVLSNLFGTVDRIAQAVGAATARDLRKIGEILAFLKSPDLPSDLGQAFNTLPIFAKLKNVNPRVVDSARFDENIVESTDVDLGRLPIQTCWPDDAGPLITWGLVITKGPNKPRQNIGIYRQQPLARNKVVMRWLSHRGGALDYREWNQKYPQQPFPLAVVIGADPATLLAAVTPVPDTLSEFQFAGLLRSAKTEVIESNGLFIPASAEFVMEGVIHPGETAREGPFGDHTGYYNAVDEFPVFTINRMRFRRDPIYHTGYMGRSPHDEPSVLAMALNEVFIPLLQQQFPEIVDFYLPPEGCSYRIAIVSIKKAYPGHARRVMFGVWSFLRQFTYTKFVIVTDDDIDARNWKEVVWALTTRTDPARDSVVVENTPIDYLDFASPVASLGSKMGLDATNKWPGETNRQWGRPIQMSQSVKSRIDAIWTRLGIL